MPDAVLGAGRRWACNRYILSSCAEGDGYLQMTSLQPRKCAEDAREGQGARHRWTEARES